MPRSPDIGWQHGTMIGGYRHHIRCNYCHVVMIGGITRFKRHLAGEGGEIKGCDAAPKEVKETIKKHLDAWQPRKYNTRKKRADGIYVVPIASHMDDGSDADASRDGTRELFDAFGEQRTGDLGWAHGLTVKGDKRKVECKYCHKIISGGGVSRLKQHLAGQRGNIAPCDKVPDDVRVQIQQYLASINKVSHETFVENHCHGDYNNDAPTSGSRRIRVKDEGGHSKKRMKLEASYNLVTSVAPQPIMQLSSSSQENIEQADIAVARFMFESGISFDAANSLYFQRMADAISMVGPGYKMPSYHSLRGALLNKCGTEVEEFGNDLRKSWEVTGCTVLVDRWKDKADKSIIDFFAYCPKGTLFLKSVDATGFETSLEALVDLFDTVVQDIGPKNIIHFVGDEDPWYKAAGKILISKYKTFFWSVSVSHYIEIMLKGLNDMDEVKWVMLKAKKVCQMIYNNQWVLELFKKITKGRDLIQQGRTKSLTEFLTIRNMFSLKDLLQTFSCASWEQSGPSLQKLGMDVKEILSDLQFWQSCANIIKVSEPLITVWNLADSGERPSIGFIYDAIERAKKDIILAFNEEEYEYLPYFNVINQARDELHSPLHAAAYFLNPSMFYSTTFSLSNIIQRGFLDCVETLEPDLIAQDNIMKQKTFYEGALGDFGRPLAVRGRDSLTPAAWWSSYASEYPDLQRFAIKVLSQTCSLIPFERPRNMNEDICSSKNKLETDRLNRLSFIRYNLRLRRRQPAGKASKSSTDEHDPLAIDDEDTEEWIKDPGEVEVKDGGIKLVDIFGPSASIPVDIFNTGHANLGN